MTQQVILAPLGMITQPNKLGQYPAGAMSLALNAYMRNPGTIEASRYWNLVISLAGLGTPTTPELWMLGFGNSPLAATIYRITTGEWACTWFAVSGAGGTGSDYLYTDLGYPSGRQHLPLDGRFGYATTGQHTMLLGALGVMAFDYTNPSTSGQRTPRQAGLYPPYYLNPVSTASDTTAGAIAPLKQFTAVAILRRKFTGENYELVSAPTPATGYFNLSTSTYDVAIAFGVFFDPAFVRVGDVVEIYRTRTQSFTTTPSVTFVAPGADYLLCAARPLTSADISASSTEIVSYASDASLGEPLYTNDGLQGGGAIAKVPPTSSCVAKFKNYTFYFRTYDPPQVSFQQLFNWSNTGSANAAVRGNTFGSLTLAGTTTASSNSVTSVSTANMVGVVIGQYVIGTGIPTLTKITATGATGFTMSAAATTSVSGGTLTVYDQIEIDGVSGRVGTFSELTSLPYGTSKYLVSCLSLTNPPTSANALFFVPAQPVVISRKDFFGDPADASKYTMTIRTTRGNLLVPALPRIELGETANTYTAKLNKNGFMWSEENQPENVPPDNFAFCGSGEIYACASTRDALWIFASDGLWRLSGTGGQAGRSYDWRIDPVDSTLSISGPQAVCVLRDTVYAYTNRGFVSIDSTGAVREISSGRIGDLLPGPPWSAPTYTGTTAMFLVADIENDEVRFREPGTATGITWIYNTLTDSFTQDTVTTNPLFYGIYSEAIRGVLTSQYAGSGIIGSPTSTVFRPLDVTWQPIFAETPFVQHHWQTVDLAVDDTTANVNLYLNGSGTTVGTQTVTPGGTSVYSRAGWMVPRNAPAVANNIGIRVLGPDLAATAMKLQGIAVRYVNITEQRGKR